MSRSRFALVCAALLLSACEKPADPVVQAAARQAAKTRILGPGDLQMLSGDGTIALEILGDTLHMMTPNSKISVPATYVEHVKYENGQLTFDIRGVGAQIFDVGNGAQGAAFRPDEALAFVSVILDRQNALEKQAGAANR